MSETAPHQELLLSSLDFVLNTERKTALAAVMMTPGDTPHTTAAILQKFRSRQGDEIIWQLTSGDCSNYMDNSLKLAGIISEPSHRHYELGLDGEEEALVGSAVGLVAKWSIDYPMVSVQELLGPTRSRGGVRAPRGRFGIYDYFFEHPEPQRYADFIGHYGEFGYKTRESFAGEIDVMKQVGIITTRNVVSQGHEPNFAEIMLTEEFYEPLRALYQGLKQLFQDGPHPGHLAYMHALCHGEDKTNFRALLAKGRFFSSPIDDEILKSWRTRVVALMQDTPEQSLTLHTIREALQRQTISNRLAVPTAQLLKLLGDLEEDGWLRSERSYFRVESSDSAPEVIDLRSRNTYRLSDKARGRR